MRYWPFPPVGFVTPDLTGFSDKQLVRLFDTVYARCCRDYGVSCFDWPTLKVIYPHRAAFLQSVKAEGKRRADAGTWTLTTKE
jgi:hypothetical protein